MYALNTPAPISALNLLNLSTIVEPNGPVYNGPGASKHFTPFHLRQLEYHQREAVERAKKYAMEQSIRAVLLKQTQSQQSQQLNNMKKTQTVALLNRVYVGSISYDVKEDMLKQAFSVFGPIKTVSMSWDPATQKHKGFAFLEFEYPEGAHLAIEQMNNASFGGRQLKVGRPSNLANADPIIAELVAEYKLENRVYVAGIHMDLTEDDVSLVFEAFGKIVFCRLQPDPSRPTGHRGFGYIEYESGQSAMDAVASMNQFNLGGQLLRVCKAISPPDGISSTTTSALPPAAAVAAASVTAKVMSMETEQLPVNTSGTLEATDHNPGNMFVPTANHILSPAVLPSEQSPFMPGTPGSASGHHSTGFGPRAQTAIPQPTVVNPVPAQPLSTWETANPEENTSFRSVAYPASIPLPPDNPSSLQQPAVESEESPPGVLILRNMVDLEDCDEELEAEVQGECSNYGPVERVLVHQQIDPATSAGCVKVFVQFVNEQSVHRAIEALNGRFFAGRQITAEPYDARAFMSNDLSH